MDRQSLIGMSLIFVVFVGWYFFVSEYYKPDPSAKNVAAQKALPANSLSREETNEVSDHPKATAAKTPFYRTGAEKKIRVETDLFTTTLSTKGATILSFIQKKYLAADRKEFELITDKTGATSLLFKMKNGDVVSTKDVYFSTTDTVLILTKDQKQTVTFEALLDSATQTKLNLQYEFAANSYIIGYKVEFVGQAKSVLAGTSYQVAWNGGLGFSETDRKGELSLSYARALLGDELVKIDAEKEKETYIDEPEGSTKWVSTQSKYFIAALVPSSPASGAYLYGKKEGDDDAFAVETYTVALKEDLSNVEDNLEKSYKLYIGPLDYNQVKSLGVQLERAMDFGWEWLTRPFAEYIIVPIFGVLENFVSNYGIILILFAVMIKIVTYPLSLSQTKSMKKMSELQPKLKKLQEQYKNNPVKLQSEMSKMYKESGVNPLGGCLPMLLQLPILFALFNVFRSSIQLRQKGFLWIEDLSAPDILFHLPFSIPLYGDAVTIFPILMAISMVIQMKLTPSAQTSTPEGAMQAKIFQYLFPIMMLLVFNNTPSGLSLYYFTFNVVSIIQQVIMNNLIKTTPSVVVGGNNVKKAGRKS